MNEKENGALNCVMADLQHNNHRTVALIGEKS